MPFYDKLFQLAYYTDRVTRIEPLQCYARGSIRLTRSVCIEISGPQLTSNSNSAEKFYSKFTKIFREAVHGFFC